MSVSQDAGQPSRCPSVDQLSKRRVLAHTLGMALVALIVLIISGGIHGRSYVEKMLTQLAMPSGLCWLGLIWLAYMAALAKRKFMAVGLGLLLTLYWLAAAPIATDWFLAQIESQYPKRDLADYPDLDVVVVLGGGTYSNAHGQAWLGPLGERVMLGARLYQQGKAKRLVATGTLYQWVDQQSIDAAEATTRMWQDLGVPAEHIEHVRGRNTSEEMQYLREWIDQQDDAGEPLQVGLVTSGFHMPRAMRLARASGLEDLVPVPGELLSGYADPLPLSLIPSAWSLMRTEVGVKELLARIVSR